MEEDEIRAAIGPYEFSDAVFRWRSTSSHDSWSKIEIMVKNQTLVENRNFGQKSNFGRKWKFWSKIKLWSKIEILVKNHFWSRKLILLQTNFTSN